MTIPLSISIPIVDLRVAGTSAPPGSPQAPTPTGVVYESHYTHEARNVDGVHNSDALARCPGSTLPLALWQLYCSVTHFSELETPRIFVPNGSIGSVYMYLHP